MNERTDEKYINNIIFFIINWYSSLINYQCLDFKRCFVYAYKTIAMSSSHCVPYLVHNSA